MYNRQDFLDKTCYGLNILSHVVLLDHPVEEGLRVSFPDCGMWPNPFDGYRRTLHVTVVKQHPEQRISNYVALYHDESGHIPDGNAIDFAGHFFSLKNQELLDKLNRDLHLHIGEECTPYLYMPSHQARRLAERQYGESTDTTAKAAETVQNGPARVSCDITVKGDATEGSGQFSFFEKPVYNKVPSATMTIPQLAAYIRSERAKIATDRLRTISDKKAARAFKAKEFDYATPGGVFTERDKSKLVKSSGLIVIDIDDLRTADEVEAVFRLLLEIPRLETQLLFRSPSGHGLKWIIRVVNNTGHSHEFYFRAVENYLKTFGITADPSGKDICRACYIPHDPNLFINPKYLQQ